MSRYLTAAACFLMLRTGPTAAHHSMSEYDFDQRVTHEGVLKELDWRRPHIYLLVDIDDATIGYGEPVHVHDGGRIRLGDWSLDGRYLVLSSGAFEAESRLYTLDLEPGGDPAVIARSDSPISNARFSPDGRYLSYSSLDENGVRTCVTRATPGTANQQQAWQLPTSGLVFGEFWDKDDPVIYQVELNQDEGSDRLRLIEIPVDTSDDFTSGEARPIAALPASFSMATAPSLSRDGERLLGVLRPEDVSQYGPPQITLLDRNGQEVTRPGEPGMYYRPSFSPNGSRILALRDDRETLSSSFWILDVASGDAGQVTEIGRGALLTSLAWMDRGEYIAYSSASLAAIDDRWIYRSRIDGQGEAEPLYRAPAGLVDLSLADVSRDGQFLVLEGSGVVQTVRLTGDDPIAREALDALRAEFEARSPRLSPDMRFLAYTCNESGRPEIYLSPFDAETGTANESDSHQISENGPVSNPAWRADGQELYSLREMLETPELNDFQVMAVSLTLEPSLETGRLRALFEISAANPTGRAALQDVIPDGQRFLFMLPTTTESAQDSGAGLPR